MYLNFLFEYIYIYVCVCAYYENKKFKSCFYWIIILHKMRLERFVESVKE